VRVYNAEDASLRQRATARTLIYLLTPAITDPLLVLRERR
jgi:hypothetical protein